MSCNVPTPHDENRFDAFMNIRVADIQAVYKESSTRGVPFITPPIPSLRDPGWGLLASVARGDRHLPKDRSDGARPPGFRKERNTPASSREWDELL